MSSAQQQQIKTMPTGKTSSLLAKDIPHAQLRFHYPRMSNMPVADEEKLRQTMSNGPGDPRAPPVPVIVKHGFEKALGVIEGDHHSKNTNPGFSRNCLGGFFTQ